MIYWCLLIFDSFIYISTYWLIVYLNLFFINVCPFIVYFQNFFTNLWIFIFIHFISSNRYLIRQACSCMFWVNSVSFCPFLPQMQFCLFICFALFCFLYAEHVYPLSIQISETVPQFQTFPFHFFGLTWPSFLSKVSLVGMPKSTIQTTRKHTGFDVGSWVTSSSSSVETSSLTAQTSDFVR